MSLVICCSISVLKIMDEILSRRIFKKLSKIFFDEVYPPKSYLTKFFVANVT